MSQRGDLVLIDFTDPVFRRELVENFAGFSERIGYGAVEIKNQRSVFH
jgi:hypothetical protein